MQRESQAPLSLEDSLTENGSPSILQCYNAKEMTSKIMKIFWESKVHNKYVPRQSVKTKIG